MVNSVVPAILAALPAGRITELDVREDLRNGREPFSRIMAARCELPPDGVLRLRAIFEPVPLYRVMEKQGFAHVTEQLAPDDWVVWFYAPDSLVAQGEDVLAGNTVTETAAGGSVAAGISRAGPDEGTATGAVAEPLVLDVTGLEPPEPMVRTLEALAQLPPGGTLIQLNVRVPQMLLPQLDARGYSYTVHEEADDRVRVVIHVPAN
jgi:hypothetical protein